MFLMNIMEPYRLPTAKATIESAEIVKISELWSRKPKGLKFNDTDALIVTLKTEDGKTLKETFYFCLKPDGTFNVNTVSKDGSHMRRMRLANFLKRYKLTDDVDEYNIKEGVKTWGGTKVGVTETDDSRFILI